MYIMYANGLCLCWCLTDSKLQNNYFDNKYFWNWSDDPADIIFTVEKRSMRLNICPILKKTSLRCTEWISLGSEKIIQVTSQQKEHIIAILSAY